MFLQRTVRIQEHIRQQTRERWQGISDPGKLQVRFEMMKYVRFWKCVLSARACTTSLAIGSWLLLASSASAQWLEQSFQLEPGWNSIYIEVDPSPSNADELFTNLAIDAVWMLAPDPLVEGPPGCPDPNDPLCAPALDSGWRIWVPPSDPARVAITLRLIRGGRVYLIKATEPGTLTLTGTPNGARARWRKGFNLAGFHVVDDPNAAPTFEAYLAPSATHTATAIYELQADGALSQITDLSNTRITPGRGVWVKSGQDVEYDGPVVIDNGSLRRVDFGKSLLEHSVTVENLTTAAREVTLTNASSASVPVEPPGLPALAGPVPLSWLDYGGGGKADQAFQWHELTTQGWTLSGTGASGARATLRLGVDRAGLASAELDEQGQGSQYQHIIEVTDGHGFRRWLSVTAQVPSGVSGTIAGTGGASARPGLYLGHVMVERVAWVSAGARVWTGGDPTDPDFAGVMRCFGGISDGEECSADQKRCVGTPEVELTQIICEEHADCPDGTTCETVTDCPGGMCRAFCAGGSSDGQPCGASVDCPDGGHCSTESDTTALRPTSTEFMFPVIIHLSDAGEYKMLTEVMWEPGDADTDTPGRFVLVTPECPQGVLNELEAGSLQDGQPFARRVSTAAFSFDGDLTLAGDFGTALVAAIAISPNDPLNPFRHKYHPDHDCLDADDEPLGPDALDYECFDVSRDLTFWFEANPPPGMDRPGWGDSLLGGIYEETLEGLHKESLHVGGRFELQRVSQIATLNAQ